MSRSDPTAPSESPSARRATNEESSEAVTRRLVRPVGAHVTQPDTRILRLRGFVSEDQVADGVTRLTTALTRDGVPRFALTGVLGRGSQGTVFRVLDRDCHREVALKVLRRGSDGESETDIARFIHEAQVTAQLEHPGIVPVHDVGRLPDGTLFYAMKLVQGGSLHDWLKERAGKPAHRFEAIELFVRICEPVAFAHSHGVLHRDLKPRNIMVGAFGEVLVLDWGLSRLVGESSSGVSSSTRRPATASDSVVTATGLAVGTPSYMAPEQARGESTSLDQRCDVYALGVILYEILTGDSPYEKAGAARVMEQASDGSWTRLDQRPGRERLPRALVAITHRAMALERADRYPTVAALANDLRCWLAGDPVSALSESLAHRLVRIVLRHQRQVRVGAWVALVAIAIGVGAWRWSTYQHDLRIAGLRRDLQSLRAIGDLAGAHSACERLIALKPDEAAAYDALRAIETEQRERAERERSESARARADALVAEAEAAIRADPSPAVYERAANAAIAALTLSPGHASAIRLYEMATGRLAAARAGAAPPSP